MSPEISFLVTYSEPMMRSAAREIFLRRLWDRMRWYDVAILLLTLAALLYLTVRGASSTIYSIAVGALVVLVLFVAGLYWVIGRTAAERVRRMRNPQAEFTLTAEHLSMSSELGNFTLHWEGATALCKTRNAWALIFARTSQVIIPIGGVPAEALALIEEALQRHGKSGR